MAPRRPRPDLMLERGLGGRVCGIDDVGRGPLAGPVLAAAVVLPDPGHPWGGLPEDVAARIDDSKRLGRALREELAAAIRAYADVGVGRAEVAEIDRLNILQASLVAMRRAVDRLRVAPDGALVDGNRAPDLACPVVTVVKGDTRSLSIAAASIVAKVARDAVMADLAARHPVYGWDRNAGYPTPHHRAALRVFGPCEHHRRSFAPVEEVTAKH
ncbi:MAG: ribonuclease HII [Rhodospirillales bacterium]